MLEKDYQSVIQGKHTNTACTLWLDCSAALLIKRNNTWLLKMSFIYMYTNTHTQILYLYT